MKREDLKIQFRAVQYSIELALEYRADPNQDLSYEVEKKMFWGLIKYKITKLFNTHWINAHYFCGWSEIHDYDCHTNWQPFWIRNQEELDEYKRKFKTIGEFEKFIQNKNEKNYEKWKIAREHYLNRIKTIY